MFGFDFPRLYLETALAAFLEEHQAALAPGEGLKKLHTRQLCDNTRHQRWRDQHFALDFATGKARPFASRQKSPVS